MTSLVTPLSRRPQRWLWALVPLLGLLLPFTRLGSPHFTDLPSKNVEWLIALYALAFAGLLCWSVWSMAVTDYDADYLYLFRETGPQPIPLASFYKLVAARGYWKLCYLDAQQQKQQLRVVPMSASWYWHADSARIRGFISAVRLHNPALDVHCG